MEVQSLALYRQLNDDQAVIYREIMDVVDGPFGGAYFVSKLGEISFRELQLKLELPGTRWRRLPRTEAIAAVSHRLSARHPLRR